MHDNKTISYITPFTLLDYPGKSACILWYAGCNMRCLYCYNPEIVMGKGTLSFSKVVTFLKSRIGLLNAVVFSGGECLIHKKIYQQIKTVKELGFLVKVDTNGSSPNILKKLIDSHLVDYVALDFKSLPNNFEFITKSNLFKSFEESLDILIESAIKYEIRTTYHSQLLSIENLQQMCHFLKEKKFEGNLYIQNYSDRKQTLSFLPKSSKLKKEDILSLQKIIIR